MAGGSLARVRQSAGGVVAAMEPRPDGRGKEVPAPTNGDRAKAPQWSPGLMAGGSPLSSVSMSAGDLCRNGAPA